MPKYIVNLPEFVLRLQEKINEWKRQAEADHMKFLTFKIDLSNPTIEYKFPEDVRVKSLYLFNADFWHPDAEPINYLKLAQQGETVGFACTSFVYRHTEDTVSIWFDSQMEVLKNANLTLSSLWSDSYVVIGYSIPSKEKYFTAEVVYQDISASKELGRVSITVKAGEPTLIKIPKKPGYRSSVEGEVIHTFTIENPTFYIEYTKVAGVGSVVVRYWEERSGQLLFRKRHYEVPFGVNFYTAPKHYRGFTIKSATTGTVEIRKDKIYFIDFYYEGGVR